MLNQPHRRFNPLMREWVLVSPQRTQRPWLGQVEQTPRDVLPVYDPTCYLCPGNARASGIRNPPYTATFVFDNDFPALRPDPAATPELDTAHPLFTAEPESGICRVVCFSPRHDLTLPELSLNQVEAVLQTWIGQTHDLSARASLCYVQVFENKGALMGCSNPHPHNQIWSTAHIPNALAQELLAQLDYARDYGRPLLSDYLEQEQRQRVRIVVANEHFTALAPFWAIWPFEIMLIAHRPVARLTELTSAEVTGLADLLRRVTARYDNLFEISFPYSMGFHQAPSDGQPHPEWVLHAHFYPPLLRSAAVRKFMVGYEMLATPQRDLTPECAAERLRALNDRHFTSL